MKINNLLIIILLISSTVSCSDNRCDCLEKHKLEILPSDYKDLVNQAVFNHLGKFYTERDSSYLDSAIMDLNQAIELSPRMLPAYYYKSIVYDAKRDYYATIEIIDSAINNSYQNPDMLFLKAKALDHLQRTKDAEKVLKETEKLYNQWVSCYPDSINLITTKTEFIAYYKGKEVALKEINKYIRQHPNNDFLLNYRELLEETPNSEILRCNK